MAMEHGQKFVILAKPALVRLLQLKLQRDRVASRLANKLKVGQIR